MSESKHTPGPWAAELSSGRGVLSVVSETHWICGEIQNALPDENAWANARLIAAAPDQHEANKISLTVLSAARMAWAAMRMVCRDDEQ